MKQLNKVLPLCLLGIILVFVIIGLLSSKLQNKPDRSELSDSVDETRTAILDPSLVPPKEETSTERPVPSFSEFMDEIPTPRTPAKSEYEKPKSQETSAIKVGADVLASQFNENEVRADLIFKGKIAFITGYVNSVESLLGDVIVRLEGVGLHTVNCTLTEGQEMDAAHLNAGNKVTILGKITGKDMIGGVSVERCLLYDR